MSCLRLDWYSSSNELDGVALALGPILAVLGEKTGYARLNNGLPVTSEQIARIARFTHEEVTSALEQLIRARMARRADDGAIGVTPPPLARRPKLPRRAVFERDDWTCVYCGCAVSMQTGHADHVVPRSRGGSDAMSNLATACAPCNRSKKDRTLEEWL